MVDGIDECRRWARPGSGSKPGVTRGPYRSTIAKEQAREEVRQVILRHVELMLHAQIAHAIGIGHLYTRDKSGRFTRVEQQSEVTASSRRGGGTALLDLTKDPSVQGSR